MMTNLELAGALFGLLSVWLTARASIWCWPTGLVSTLLFIVVFAGARLYGDVLTNVLFSALGVYGWHQWLRGGPLRSGRRIARASRPARAAVVAVCAAGIPLAGLALRAAGSALPWWDGAILVLSLVAQFLLGRKLIESWLLWIAVDVLSIGVYLARQLVAVTALYAVFLVLAIHGLRQWAREGAAVDSTGGPSITGGTRRRR